MKKRFLPLELLLAVALVAALLVIPGIASARTCTGANPNDSLPDASALNSCFAGGGTIYLNPGSPGYIVDRSLSITESGTYLTSSQAPTLVNIIAAPGLTGPVLRVEGFRSYVTVNYMRFDGNRPNRTNIAAKCDDVHRLEGSTVVFMQNDGLTFDNNEITRTVCGTALSVKGTNITVTRNVLRDNGHGREAVDAYMPWSDGITVVNCVHGLIWSNTIIDATDVGIVVFSSRDCQIRQNAIMQRYRHAFIGIALHAFGPNDTQRHTDTVVGRNTITGNRLLSFGLSFGVHPVYPAATVVGGEFLKNNVSGAFVNLVVDGVKSATGSVPKVTENVLSNPGGTRNCGSWTPVNYARDIDESQGLRTQGGYAKRDYDNCVP
jgi:parallel beta-helix repeat protein